MLRPFLSGPRSQVLQVVELPRFTNAFYTFRLINTLKGMDKEYQNYF